MTHVRISQEAAVEAPGDGQRAIIEELRNRRKLIVLENADLDAEMYWSRRQNLANGACEPDVTEGGIRPRAG